MCFPKVTKPDPTPLLDEEGAIIEEESSDLYVPEGIHEHVDSVYLNFDFVDGILAFVYENSNGVIVVWRSPEVQHFGELCDALELNILQLYKYSQDMFTLLVCSQLNFCLHFSYISCAKDIKNGENFYVLKEM